MAGKKDAIDGIWPPKEWLENKLSEGIEDAKFDNSVTYPDGSTVTTSPGGGGGVPDTVVESGGDPVSAINNASAGDHIHIKSGTYTISTGIELNASGVTVTGEGMGQTVLYVDGGANIYPFRIGNTSAVTDIELRGFTIDGNYANHSGPYDNYYHGLFGQDVTRCFVNRVEVKNTYPYSGNDDTSNATPSTGGGDGILFNDLSADIWIEDCYVHDCQWRGIDFWGTRGRVENCKSIDNVDRGISGNEWVESGQLASDRFWVLWNEATGGTHTAACIGARDGVTDTIIVGNYCHDQTDGSEIRRGIVVENNDRFIIAFNNLDTTNFQNAAITASDHGPGGTNGGKRGVILGNQIYNTGGNGARGIFIHDQSHDIVVANNTVEAPGGNGIRTDSFDGGATDSGIMTSIIGNVVTDCIIRIQSAPPSIMLKGNTINGGNIYIRNCIDILIEGNHVSAEPGGTSNDKSGIAWEKPDANVAVIKNNHLRDVTENGIDINSTSPGDIMYLHGNHFAGGGPRFDEYIIVPSSLNYASVKNNVLEAFNDDEGDVGGGLKVSCEAIVEGNFVGNISNSINRGITLDGTDQIVKDNKVESTNISSPYKFVDSTNLVASGNTPVPADSQYAADTISNETQYIIGLADKGKQALLQGQANWQFVTVVDKTNNNWVTAMLEGGSNAVTLIDGDTGSFSTTEGNDTTINLYWDGTNSQYELNNETGGSADFEVHYGSRPHM